MGKIILAVFIFLALLTDSGTGFAADEEMSREAFYAFISEYNARLFQITEMYDSSLSVNTNRELRIRTWNDYLSQNLPKRIWVNIPLDKITLGKSSFQRLEARIEFDFSIEFPQNNLKFENNIDSQNQFEVDKELLEKEQKEYLFIKPRLKNIIIEAGIASKHDIIVQKGYLLLEIKMNISRGTSWLQFHDTILSFNSVKWIAGNEILWELKTMPLEEIMRRSE
jgi:hypothetical protein